MSKRLSKRQQRELEELEKLKAQEKSLTHAEAAPIDSEEDEEDVEEEAPVAVPVNAFAALGGNDTADVSEDEEEDEPSETVVKKSRKKKPKKKKKPSAVQPEPTEEAEAGPSTPPSSSTPAKGGKKEKGKADDEMDEVDRALAELNMKPATGEANDEASAKAGPSQTRNMLKLRSLLSVDPKNLDADAELRRFFGSKVIASTNQSSGNRHRPGPSAKLRYTLSKPKANYPPATSLAGLIMRQLTEEEEEAEQGGHWSTRRRSVDGDADQWFTFEHSPAWREVQRQFLGAVRSHDPNELMALLQVYPWHVDTLLQMSEVYRLQSDIGAASEYAERALYAFDRCLAPGFNVSSGLCRLDFQRVENRPMFLALHRIISYLGRRGCWVTAFNFAKLLFSLDPRDDPHGAALWLDFLAIKTGNGEFLISMLESAQYSPAAERFHAYPGMAYAQALALRADENAKKHGDHTESDLALQEAMRKFPQVIVPLSDKIGASISDVARSHPLLQVEASYTDSWTNVFHLLSHIYVSRSEPLWKEASMLKWFESQVPLALATIDSPSSVEARATAAELVQTTPDDIDYSSNNVPMNICRHVFCSESTSWLGFIPPNYLVQPLQAYDPLPPEFPISQYDAAYFNGVSLSQPGRGSRGPGELFDRLMAAANGGDEGWQERIGAVWEEMRGRRGYEGLMPWNEVELLQGQPQGNGGMPGGFPGADQHED